MSNKIAKIKENIEEEQTQETKEMTVQIDVEIDNVEKSTYLVITGIPKDLPEEFEPTVLRTAEGQFAQALNARLFLEFYSLGKSAKDEKPVFINLSKVNTIKVTNVKKI